MREQEEIAAEVRRLTKLAEARRMTGAEKAARVVGGGDTRRYSIRYVKTAEEMGLGKPASTKGAKPAPKTPYRKKKKPSRAAPHKKRQYVPLKPDEYIARKRTVKKRRRRA